MFDGATSSIRRSGPLHFHPDRHQHYGEQYLYVHDKLRWQTLRQPKVRGTLPKTSWTPRASAIVREISNARRRSCVSLIALPRTGFSGWRRSPRGREGCFSRHSGPPETQGSVAGKGTNVGYCPIFDTYLEFRLGSGPNALRRTLGIFIAIGATDGKGRASAALVSTHSAAVSLSK